VKIDVKVLDAETETGEQVTGKHIRVTRLNDGETSNNAKQATMRRPASLLDSPHGTATAADVDARNSLVGKTTYASPLASLFLGMP